MVVGYIANMVRKGICVIHSRQSLSLYLQIQSRGRCHPSILTLMSTDLEGEEKKGESDTIDSSSEAASSEI